MAHLAHGEDPPERRQPRVFLRRRNGRADRAGGGAGPQRPRVPLVNVVPRAAVGRGLEGLDTAGQVPPGGPKAYPSSMSCPAPTL